MNCWWRFSLWIWWITVANGFPSFNTLSYYETLDYDPSLLRNQHHRAVRSAADEDHGRVRLYLTAFNRSFISSLSHAKGVFGKSVKFMVDGVKTDEYDPRTFYGGQLEGEPGSRVRGHIMDGVFAGVIHSVKGTFHVEKAHKFFSGPQKFHSIIYRDVDVAFPEQLSASSCGVKGRLMEQLSSRASQAIPLHDDKNMVYGTDRFSRLKRQVNSQRLFCPIRVAADHLFLASVGGGSVVNTMSQIAAIISDVQDIFAATDFNGDGNADSVQPVIVSLEVLQQGMSGYRYGAPSIEVNDFLDLWSQENQSDYCLALLLTHRDFRDGVLGLAWVAESSGGNRGGICERGVQLAAGVRFLNTAIVTFLNYGRTQPQSVSTVTIAHEFGHNFGSNHDPAGTCSPGGSQGNFIMFPQATDGALTNNKLFSSCSINEIRRVLDTESGCFTQTEAFCGNGILEEREECDCGRMCQSDVCCDDDCHLTTGSQCSSLEECCNSTCQYSPPDRRCLPQTECGEASFCTGNSGTCPAPIPRRGNGLCNNDRNVCIDGVCAGSICITMNATDCQCSISAGNPESTLCHVCCRVGSGPCESSFELFDEGQEREAGRSCNNFDGYCSNESPPRCVLVDNERTLDDLLDIFNINTLNAIAAWLQVYWYVPVAVVAIIAIFIFLLHITYRKRKPIKKGINRVRRSTIRRQQQQQVTSTPSNARARRPAANPRSRPGHREISQGEGERRLKQFFPTADYETMVSVMRAARSESKAVQRMIELGYPLCKLPLPQS